MNALLQHRGYVLLSAGHSIAVQNFNENISILLMLAIYSAMIKATSTSTPSSCPSARSSWSRCSRDAAPPVQPEPRRSLHLIGMKTSKQRGYP